MRTTPAHYLGWRGLALLVAGISTLLSQAQSPPLPRDAGQLLPRECLLCARPNETTPWLRVPRPRFFRAPFGYLHEPSEAEPLEPADDDGRFQFCMAPDNPYLDFRRPGDPGGVGYFKVQTLVPLFGTESVELSVGLQAVTPAGLEADGLADGHTVVSPTLMWFQDFGGPALQGFVAQHVPALSRTGDPMQRGWFYGVAFQQPLSSGAGGLHLFIEALGKQRRELLPGQRGPASWELLPGLHWRISESCWMSGGVLLPLGSVRPDPGLWQFTCKWQF